MLTGCQGQGRLGGGLVRLVPVQAWSSPVAAARHCSTMLGGDAPAGRDATVFSPRPDTAGALPACCRPPWPAWLSLASPAHMPMKGASLRPNVVAFLAQVDLILSAADPEPDRLIRRPIKIVFQSDGYLLCDSRLPGCDRLSTPDKINCHAAAITAPPGPQSPSSRSIPGPPGSGYHGRQAAGLKQPTQEPTATGFTLHRATPSHLRRRQMPHQATSSIFEPPSGRTF
jgi:hypothetical protein